MTAIVSTSSDLNDSTQPLLAVMSSFGERVNQTARLRTMLKGWDRTVFFQPLEQSSGVLVVFAGSVVTEVHGVPDEPSVDIVIRATDERLQAVFSGKENPTEHFLNGELQIFASDRDQVKLDALALVLWD